MRHSFRITLLALLVALPLQLSAQRRTSSDREDRDDERNGPTLGVARVSLADGDVRIKRPNADEYQAQASMPLVARDVIMTGTRSRAEVQFDNGNFMRLDADSEARIEGLGNKSFQVEVVRGVINYSQLRGGEADAAIDTPLAGVRILERGTFTVEYRDSGQTTITVRNGSVEVTAGNRSQKLKKGMMIVRGEPRNPEVRTAKADPKNGFDEWNQRRDKMLDRGSRYGGWGYGPYWGPYYAGYGYGWGGWGYPYYGWGPSFGTVIVHRGGGRGGHGGGHHGGGGRR